jgi:hypothetical protein
LNELDWTNIQPTAVSPFQKYQSLQWLQNGDLVAEYQTTGLELYPVFFSDGAILFIQRYSVERENKVPLMKSRLIWLKDGKKINELNPDSPVSGLLSPNLDGSKIWYSTSNGLFVIEDQKSIRQLLEFENNDLYPYLTLSKDFETIAVRVKNEVHLLSSDDGSLLAKTDFTGIARRYIHFDSDNHLVVNFGDRVSWLKKENDKLVEKKSVKSQGDFRFLTMLPSGKFIVKESVNFKPKYVWLENGTRSAELNQEIHAAEFFPIFSDDTVLIPSRAGFEGADTDLVLVKDGKMISESSYFKELRIRANDSTEMYLLLSNGQFVAVDQRAKKSPRIVWLN